ncbi:hypothetical protein D3C85_1847510 [compost metagenome]
MVFCITCLLCLADNPVHEPARTTDIDMDALCRPPQYRGQVELLLSALVVEMGLHTPGEIGPGKFVEEGGTAS